MILFEEFIRIYFFVFLVYKWMVIETTFRLSLFFRGGEEGHPQFPCHPLPKENI